MFTLHPSRRRTLTPLVPQAVSDRVGAAAVAFVEVVHEGIDGKTVTIRQPGEPAPEPPRAQAGSLNDVEALVKLTGALAEFDASFLSGWPPDNANIRAQAYQRAGLGALTENLAARGRLDMLDRMACDAELRRREMRAAAVRQVSAIGGRHRTLVRTGAEAIIAEPWRVGVAINSRDLGSLPPAELVPLLRTRIRNMRWMIRTRHFGASGNALLALQQAYVACRYAVRASGWDAARVMTERRSAPGLQAAE